MTDVVLVAPDTYARVSAIRNRVGLQTNALSFKLALTEAVHIQSTLHSVNGFKRDRSTPSKEKRAKEPSIQRTSHLVNEHSGYGARLLNAMLTVYGD